MPNAHTPGPWSIVSYLDEHDRRGANVLVGHDVAGARHRIHSANHTIAYTVPTLADARLIAQAPRLLEILAAIYAGKSKSTQEMRYAADAHDTEARAILRAVKGE